MKKLFRFAVIILIILLAISPEGECRRKILKGRKAITRTYYRESLIPSWALVVLVGIGELLAGALLFVIMYFTVLRDEKPYAFRNISARPISP